MDTPTACAQAPGFRSELIPLPPSFAPDMPVGTELLWFAPGMFDATSSGYWSYVFSLDMPSHVVAGPRALEDLLNIYYRGLIAAVGESRNIPIDASAISAAATRVDDNSYRVDLTVPDAFGSGEDVALRLQILVDGHCLRATASPIDSTLQADLVRALQCLPCGTP